MRRVAIHFVAFVIGAFVCDELAAEKIHPEVLTKIQSVYSDLHHKLRNVRHGFGDKLSKVPHLRPNDVKIETDASGKPEKYRVRADYYLSLASDGESILTFGCIDRHEKVKDGATSKVLPALSVLEAIERAKEILADLDIAIPEDFKLAFAEYSDASWSVSWRPEFEGYEQYNAREEWGIKMVVAFHEASGFLGMRLADRFDVVRTYDVRTNRDDAVVKASRVAHLLFETDAYKAWLPSSFMVSGFTAAELMIVAPNWIFDSKRALSGKQWWDSPERRLCWVVRFATLKSDPGLTVQSPQLMVFVDASSGEIVGGDFL